MQRIVELYEIVKSVLLFGEEIAPQNVTLPQILKEQRDALDHFIRVLAVKTGVKAQPSNEYVGINLDKAFSHVYRAAYDTLDWISIILRHGINVGLGGYSASAIQASIPEYYSTIRPRIDSVIPERIAQIRGEKDIGAPEPKSILEYADLVAELKKYWNTVVLAKPGLIDYSRKEKKAKRKEYLIVAVITAVITGLAVGLPLAFK